MNEEYLKVFSENKLPFSRNLGSKSGYSKQNEDHFVIFNARIYTQKDYEKYKDKEIKDFFLGQKREIWYGDLDLNLDIKRLRNISLKIGTLVITTEQGTKIIEISGRMG